jgi:isoaspartyl peptidase/L-asparaginase-like protein (Ntn-hydrolase superfamily)
MVDKMGSYDAGYVAGVMSYGGGRLKGRIGCIPIPGLSSWVNFAFSLC